MYYSSFINEIEKNRTDKTIYSHHTVNKRNNKCYNITANFEYYSLNNQTACK